MRIIKINASNPQDFDNHISDCDSIIKFFLPGCGHCEDMQGDWSHMVNKLKKTPGDKKRVKIFEVNGEAIPNIRSPLVKKINGFPTILKSSNGNYNPSTDVYNGDRSADHMLQWSLAKLKNSLDLYKTMRKKVNYPRSSSKTRRKKPKRKTVRRRKPRRRRRRRR